MSIKVIALTDEGVFNGDIKDLPKEELINLELSLMISDSTSNLLSCITCSRLFKGGVMSSHCEAHR